MNFVGNAAWASLNWSNERALDFAHVFKSNNVKLLELIKAVGDAVNHVFLSHQDSCSGASDLLNFFSKECGESIRLVKTLHFVALPGEISKEVSNQRRTDNRDHTFEKVCRIATLCFTAALDISGPMEWMHQKGVLKLLQDRGVTVLNDSTLEIFSSVKKTSTMALAILAVAKVAYTLTHNQPNNANKKWVLGAELVESTSRAILEFDLCQYFFQEGQKCSTLGLKLIKALGGYAKAAFGRHTS